MTIQIEDIVKQTKGDVLHFTFALTLAFEDLGTVKTKGWRYYPSTASVQAPSVQKGGGRWTTTQWLTGALYESVVAYVPTYFISHQFCEEPWELNKKPESKEKKKRPKTQEQWNTEYFARKEKEKKN